MVCNFKITDSVKETIKFTQTKKIYEMNNIIEHEQFAVAL